MGRLGLGALLATKCLLLAVLGVDPNCAAYKRGYLRNYSVQLDSHIVLRAIVGAGSDLELCLEVLSRGRELGVDMVLSDAMAIEVQSAFESALYNYACAGNDVFRMVDLYENLGKKMDILSGFLAERERMPRLSFEAFVNRCFSPIDGSKLNDYIQSELGVRVEETCEFSKEEHAKIDDISTMLLKSRGQFCPPPSHGHEQERRWNREANLRTNEARQIFMVYKKRTANTASAKQFWFLTFDQFVYQVSLALGRSPSSEYNGPCYLKPARWLEILTNCSTTQVAVNVFRETLLSDTLQSAADMIEDRVIAEMLKSRVDQTIRSIEMLRRMFADVVNRPAVQDAYSDLVNADSRNRLKAVDNAEKAVIDSMADVIKQRERDIEERDAELAESKKAIETGKKREKYLRAELTRARKGRK